MISMLAFISKQIQLISWRMGGGRIIGIAKLSRRGLMVLPKEVREALKLEEGDQVVFIEEGGKIVLVRGPVEVKV